MRIKYFIIILLFSVNSCQLLKNSFNKKQKVSNNIQDNLFKRCDEIKYYESKFSAKLKSPDQNANFFGTVKLIKDSLIYISVSPGFGFTIAELYATKDTSLLYFPMNSNYYAGGADLLFDTYSIPFDFYSLQAIFLACPFSYPYFINLSSYCFKRDSTLVFENTIFNKNIPDLPDVKHKMYLDNNLTVSENEISDYILNKEFYITNNSYYKEEHFFLPDEIFFKIIEKDTLSLKLNFKRIEINDTFEFEYKIPNNVKIINH